MTDSTRHLASCHELAKGLKVDWAYAPGQVKVLTSSDGANFEEAKCWQSSTRTEVAYEESFMFDAPRTVKAVTIVMRSVRPSVAAVLVLSAFPTKGPNLLMMGHLWWSGASLR